jgi:hypothetical protein
MLQTRKVGEYTISEAGPLEAARIMRLSARYTEMLEAMKTKGDLVTDDDMERLQALAIWPQVAACVVPAISADDWLQIPLTIVSELRTAAEILNPSWFMVSTPAAEKKTRAKRHKSTSA